MQETKFTGIFSKSALSTEQIILSKHVIQRIEERQLDPEKLWRTINLGEKSFDLNSKIVEYRYTFKNETYIILRDFTNGVVVTAYTQKTGSRKEVIKYRRKKRRYLIAEQRQNFATLFA